MMAEIPMVAPRNLAEAMRAVVQTHTVIKDSIRAHADNISAERKANEQRMSAEQGLGYKAT